MNIPVNADHVDYRMRVCSFFLFLILQLSCHAYAETQSELVDIDTEAALSGAEETAPSKLHGHLGGEINYARRIVDGTSYKGRPVPLYLVEYDHWVYARNTGGIEGGVWLWQTPDHMQKLGVSVQRHAELTKEFNNTQRRKASADGVINAQWRGNNNFIHLSYHHDIGNASNGDSAVLVLSHNIIFRRALFDHDCMLVPGINLEWESARLVDYYYGVRPEEASPDRPAYTGRETLNGGARITGFYRINRSWTAFLGTQTVFLGPGITDSPIVHRRVATRGYVGAAWLF